MAGRPEIDTAPGGYCPTAPPGFDPNIYNNAGDDRKIQKAARDTGYTPEQIGDAIHDIKSAAGLDDNEDLDIRKGGDIYLPGGDPFGNLSDWITGKSGQRGTAHGRGSKDPWGNW